MKKFAPVLVIIGIIIIAIVAFTLSQRTAEAPVVGEPPATTTAATSTTTPPSSGPIGIAPTGTVKEVIKVYANPAWGFNLRYDTAWNLTQTGKVVNVDSPTASFLISPEQEIAEPARLTEEETTRTILGQKVDVTRYENPRDDIAYYEFFTLRINKTEYYFKVLSKVDPNPTVEKFLADMVLQ